MDENIFEGLFSMDAEQSVLGALLIDGYALERIKNFKEDFFYYAPHRWIFKAISGFVENPSEIDAVSVSEKIEEMGIDRSVVDLSYLVELVQNTPSSANISRYAEIVKNRYADRKLVSVSKDIEDIVFSRKGGTVNEKCSFAVNSIVSICDLIADKKKSEQSFFESLNGVVSFLDEKSKNPGSIPGYTTGFKSLDEKIGGLQKGNLILIAARPGMGKTVLAENIAKHCAKNGLKVHYQSLEMTQRELATRSIASDLSIPIKNLKTANLADVDYENIGRYLSECKNICFDVDTENLTVESISLLMSGKKHRSGLDVLFIDHLHLMTFSGNGSEVEELANITRNLKKLAMDLDIPIVLVAQLNRENTRKQNKEPMLSDIRGSGAIEQDANVVIMPHRPCYYDEDEHKRKAELYITKNRDGETGIVECAFYGEYARFEDIEVPFFKPNGKNKKGFML